MAFARPAWLSLLSAALLLFAWTAGAAAQSFEPLTIATAGGARHAFMVEVARTDAERAQGLMFRRTLAAARGMLCDLKRVEPVTMWMQTPSVSLDMGFIRRDASSARIAANTEPPSTRTTA